MLRFGFRHRIFLWLRLVIRISSGRIVAIQRNATKASPEEISW